jgi:hypothetical protein
VTEADFHKREEALREYYFVQDLIDRFDERSLKIKSWSVTSCGVALGFGVAENQPLLFGVAAFGSLVFWYLEALWKALQAIAIERSKELEKLLSQQHIVYDGPKISQTFIRSFRSRDHAQKFRKTLFFPNVRVPHFLIFGAGVLLFIASLLQWKL